MAPLPPRPDPARARRVLAIAAAGVVAAQLATGLALDAAPPSVRFRQGAKVLARARALGPAPYVLVLGTSRFWDLDTDAAAAALHESLGAEIPPLVKGAVPAGDPVVADFLLARLLAAGSRPGLVVLEVSPETIARPAGWVAEHAIRLFTWRDVVTWSPEIVAAGKADEVAAARLAPIGLYRRELLGWMVGRLPPYLYVPRAGTPPRVAKPPPAAGPPAIVRVAELPAAPRTRPTAATLSGVGQTRRWLRGYRSDGGTERALARVLARCHEAGVPVVLVGVPVTSWVRALYTPAVERAFRSTIDDLCRRYGAEFVDYRARVPDRAFKDHHHLNARGATAFARVLAAEVMSPRVAQGTTR